MNALPDAGENASCLTCWAYYSLPCPIIVSLLNTHTSLLAHHPRGGPLLHLPSSCVSLVSHALRVLWEPPAFATPC
eukprot:3937501-Rhodomonas_salina.1